MKVGVKVICLVVCRLKHITTLTANKLCTVDLRRFFSNLSLLSMRPKLVILWL